MEQEDTLNNSNAYSMVSEANQKQAQAQAQQYYVEEQEKNLAESQLDCEKTLTNIYHKLKQDYLEPTPDGRMEWKPIAPEDRVLTDLGVNKIMQVMETYVNKETLLSNFDDIQIRRRMLDFCKALNAHLYFKYEVYFRLPTLEECKKILDERIDREVQYKITAKKMFGEELDIETARREVMEQFGSSLHDELQSIFKAKKMENLREYELLFTEMKAIVDATHNRAWKGEERGSLRRHFNIAEVIGKPAQQENKGMFKWLSK